MHFLQSLGHTEYAEWLDTFINLTTYLGILGDLSKPIGYSAFLSQRTQLHEYVREGFLQAIPYPGEPPNYTPVSSLATHYGVNNKHTVSSPHMVDTEGLHLLEGSRVLANTLEALVDHHTILGGPPGKEMVALVEAVDTPAITKHKEQAQGTVNIPRVTLTRTGTSAMHL